jgi:hypothetical protein
MSELGQFQDAFVAALAERTAAPIAAWLPDGEAEPAGLAVYRNTIAKGCVDALAANFPTVASLVGDDWFRAAAALFAREHPPASAALLAYGEAFPTGWRPSRRPTTCPICRPWPGWTGCGPPPCSRPRPSPGRRGLRPGARGPGRRPAAPASQPGLRLVRQRPARPVAGGPRARARRDGTGRRPAGRPDRPPRRHGAQPPARPRRLRLPGRRPRRRDPGRGDHRRRQADPPPTSPPSSPP